MFDDFLIKRFSFNNIVWGFIIGFFLFIYPAAVFYILAVIIISPFLYKKLDKDERSYVLNIFYAALFLRLVFIIVTHILASYYGFGPKSTTFPGMGGGGIIGDDIGIHQRAWALASTLRGVFLSEKAAKILLPLDQFNQYGWSIHVYILALFYYLFGAVPLLGKCLNALFGVLTGIIVYFISRDLFGIKTAKLSCALTLFYPTLFLWSITNLKDTLLIFFLTLSIFYYVLFQRLKQPRILFLFLLSLFLFSAFRSHAIVITMLILLAILFINIKWNLKKALAVGVLVMMVFSSGPIKQKLSVYTYKLIEQQGASVSSGGSVYKIYPARFYHEGYKAYNETVPIQGEELLASLGKGMLALVFKPYFSEINNIYKVSFYPIVVANIFLLFFFVMGTIHTLRLNCRSGIFLITLFSLISVLIALSEGNVGTMIRHRDMVIPIYMIFASFGMVQLFSRK